MKPLLRLKPRLGTPRRNPIIALLGDIATLLALSALCGWLLTLVKDKALPPISGSVISNPLPLAVAPLAGGAALALTGTVLAVVIALAVRQTRKNDIEAELRWSERGSSEPLPLPPEDLRRIIWAVTEEVCTACEHVRKAQGDLSVEDYGAKLAAAEQGLRGAITCLGDVMKRLNADAAGGAQAMTVRVKIHTASLCLVDGAEIEAASTIAAVLQALQPGSVAARHLSDLPFAAITITAETMGNKPQTLNEERHGKA